MAVKTNGNKRKTIEKNGCQNERLVYLKFTTVSATMNINSPLC